MVNKINDQTTYEKFLKYYIFTNYVHDWIKK